MDTLQKLLAVPKEFPLSLLFARGQLGLGENELTIRKRRDRFGCLVLWKQHFLDREDDPLGTNVNGWRIKSRENGAYRAVDPGGTVDVVFV